MKTTHYTGTVTLDELRASLKGEDKATREQREKSLEQYEKLGVDKLTMDMWVDGDDHTKQFRMRGDRRQGPARHDHHLPRLQQAGDGDGPARQGHRGPGRDDEGTPQG